MISASCTALLDGASSASSGMASGAATPVIEDACQFAWAACSTTQTQVQPRDRLAWLVKTAVHEALKLTAPDATGRRRSDDGARCPASSLRCPGARASRAVYEQRERLGELWPRCPPRQQRCCGCARSGSATTEIASAHSCTPADGRAPASVRTARTSAHAALEVSAAARARCRARPRFAPAPTLPRPPPLAPAPLGGAELARLWRAAWTRRPSAGRGGGGALRTGRGGGRRAR